MAPVPGVGLKDAEAAMDRVIVDFLAKGVDPDQFKRLKTQLTAALIYQKDSVGDLAETYGAAVTSGLTVKDVQDWPQVLQAVTEEAVMTAAREVLDRRHAVTGWAMRDGADEVMQ